jgi:hypothetical protein
MILGRSRPKEGSRRFLIFQNAPVPELKLFHISYSKCDYVSGVLLVISLSFLSAQSATSITPVFLTIDQSYTA